MVKTYRAGKIPDAEFMAFRLRLGVYGQRQPDAQMLRIKIPGGLIHAGQLEALAEIGEKYVPLRKGHITTRENIQMHHLKLEGANEAMLILQRVGLSTKEACGNTVRNVVGCPMVGVDPNQAFDVQPYLGAFVRNFVRRDFTHHMPRKIKPAFSCGDHDCAVVGMHDLGFTARVKEENGRQRKGFKITVGGGTSIQPLVAETLYEFVPVEEFLKVSEAVLRVFNRTSWLRQNKMKARIKVLIHSQGINSFREQIDQELTEEWAQNYGDGEELLFYDDEEADIPDFLPQKTEEGLSDAAYLSWKETNVVPQTQSGFNFVSITVPQGDLMPEQFLGLATIARTKSSHRLRTTPEQNLMLRWVRDGDLYSVYQDLKKIGLEEGNVNNITDTTSCPGTDTCKLGITSSMGVNRAISSALKNPNGHSHLLEDSLIKGMHIKMSGCPNGCGRHHVADIGFHGAAMQTTAGNQLPAYELLVGGSYENADLRYGQRVRGRVPAKMVPDITFKILEYYKNNREINEPFKEFVQRVGKEPFEVIVADLPKIGALGKETIDLYMDYDKSVLYKMERGEGECSV